MASKLGIAVERLEERELLSASPFGYAWADPQNISFSFARDNTAVGVNSSDLFAKLDRVAQTSEWQSDILRAYQAWVSASNINIHVVSDSPQAFGSRGSPQNDPGFGDLRIGAHSMSNNVLGISTPAHPTAGTSAGDTLLNTRFNFSLGGGSGAYDLYTVLLQESGHALGLGNSPDRASVMFEQYIGARTGLSAGDIREIQKLYGVRVPDGHEGSRGNNSSATATTLRLASDSDKALLTADLTTAGDVDYYELKGIAGRSENITVKLHTQSLSLLAPRLTVYANDEVIGTVASNRPLTQDLKIRINSPIPGAKYYVKVSSDSSSAFNVGAYRLKVYDGRDPGDGEDGGAYSTVADRGSNETLATSTNLNGSSSTSEPGYSFSIHGSIEQQNDFDFYKLNVPQQAGQSSTMLVQVWSEGRSRLNPRVLVFDNQGAQVPTDVLVNEDGSYVLQVSGVDRRGSYCLRVAANDPGSASNGTGDYFLGVQFRASDVVLDAGRAKTLTEASQTDAVGLLVRQSQLFHFALGATSSAETSALVRLVVTDRVGRVVTTADASSGDTTSFKVYLTPGHYTFTFSIRNRSGQPWPSMSFKLRYLALSDPIGPQEGDPIAPSSPSSEPAQPYEWTPPPPSDR